MGSSELVAAANMGKIIGGLLMSFHFSGFIILTAMLIGSISIVAIITIIAVLIYKLRKKNKG